MQKKTVRILSIVAGVALAAVFLLSQKWALSYRAGRLGIVSDRADVTLIFSHTTNWGFRSMAQPETVTYTLTDFLRLPRIIRLPVGDLFSFPWWMIAIMWGASLVGIWMLTRRKVAQAFPVETARVN